MADERQCATIVVVEISAVILVSATIFLDKTPDRVEAVEEEEAEIWIVALMYVLIIVVTDAMMAEMTFAMMAALMVETTVVETFAMMVVSIAETAEVTEAVVLNEESAVVASTKPTGEPITAEVSPNEGRSMSQRRLTINKVRRRHHR